MHIHKIERRLCVVAKPYRPQLEPDLEALVQSLWEAERSDRAKALFNGALFSVDELAPERITGAFVDYRLFVAQRRQPDLFQRLCIRPLAVSGVIESPDGFIFGRRSSDLMTDGGKWELVPSGGLDPETCLHDCAVDYMEQFYKELAEETGITKAQISGAFPFVLVEDPTTHVFDLGIAAETPLLTTQINLAFNHSHREYSELRIVEASQLAGFYEEQGLDIVTTSAMLLRSRENALPR
jgi:hypothetical protein